MTKLDKAFCYALIGSLLILSACSSSPGKNAGGSKPLDYKALLTGGSQTDCAQAVGDAIKNGESGAAALIDALKDPDANPEAVAELIKAAKDDAGEAAAPRAGTAHDILKKIFAGLAGGKMQKALFGKMYSVVAPVSGGSPLYPGLLPSLVDAYKAGSAKDRADAVGLLAANTEINNEGFIYVWLSFYSTENDPEIKSATVGAINKKILEYNQFDEFWEPFIRLYSICGITDNQLNESMFETLVLDLGLPAEMHLVCKAADAGSPYAALYNKIKPSIPKREIIEASFKDDLWRTDLASYLHATRDAEYLNDLVSLLNTAIDPRELEQICRLLSIYEPNEAITAGLLNKLKDAAVDGSIWVSAAVTYLYENAAIGFDDALEICAKFSVNDFFATSLVNGRALNNAVPDNKVTDFLADTFNQRQSDVTGGEIRKYFTGLLGKYQAQTKSYIDGFNKQKIAGLDRNKTVVIEIWDNFQKSGSVCSFSPYTFLLVPEKNRVSIDGLNTAGTVIYLHYTYVNRTAYTFKLPPGTTAAGEMKTFYGYETNCIVTKMDITSGKVISENVWSGAKLKSEGWISGEAKDFSMPAPSMEDNIDALRAIISGGK